MQGETMPIERTKIAINAKIAALPLLRNHRHSGRAAAPQCGQDAKRTECSGSRYDFPQRRHNTSPDGDKEAWPVDVHTMRFQCDTGQKPVPPLNSAQT